MQYLSELTTALCQDLMQYVNDIGASWRIMEEYAHVVVRGHDRHAVLTPTLSSVCIQLYLSSELIETESVNPDEVKGWLLDFFNVGSEGGGKLTVSN
jgi:hypothetical protein